MDILSSQFAPVETLSHIKQHFFSPIQTTPDFSALAEHLHQSLNVAEILTTFVAEAQCCLNLTGLQFISHQESHTCGDFENGIFEFRSELTSNGRKIAEITYSSLSEIKASDASLLLAMQNKLAQPIVNALRFSQIEKMNRTDYLTGLGNRAYFEEQVDILIEKCRRHQHGLAIMVLDLDNFKQANDSQGHSAGDDILQSFADILRTCTRKIDLLFRFGGDEFVILLDEEDSHTTEIVASRIQKQLNEAANFQEHNISVSIGCANWHNESADSLFKRADRALYHAKYDGKNQIKVA